jgi:nitrogen regulatory protein PII
MDRAMSDLLPTHAKKRIEIIIEAPMLARLLDLLDRLAVTGYTVVPAIAGRGREGSWREGQLTEAGRMVMVVCITDGARMQAVLDPVYKLLARQIGIVSVADVQVVRKDHF